MKSKDELDKFIRERLAKQTNTQNPLIERLRHVAQQKMINLNK
jgi:hypothetical protein